MTLFTTVVISGYAEKGISSETNWFICATQHALANLDDGLFSSLREKISASHRIILQGMNHFWFALGLLVQGVSAPHIYAYDCSGPKYVQIFVYPFLQKIVFWLGFFSDVIDETYHYLAYLPSDHMYFPVHERFAQGEPWGVWDPWRPVLRWFVACKYLENTDDLLATSNAMDSVDIVRELESRRIISYDGTHYVLRRDPRWET